MPANPLCGSSPAGRSCLLEERETVAVHPRSSGCFLRDLRRAPRNAQFLDIAGYWGQDVACQDPRLSHLAGLIILYINNKSVRRRGRSWNSFVRSGPAPVKDADVGGAHCCRIGVIFQLWGRDLSGLHPIQRPDAVSRWRSPYSMRQWKPPAGTVASVPPVGREHRLLRQWNSSYGVEGGAQTALNRNV